MAIKQVYGTIIDGKVDNGSGDVQCEKIGTGKFKVTFPSFHGYPTVVATPFSAYETAQVIVDGTWEGHTIILTGFSEGFKDGDFTFIAIGEA